MRLHEIFGLVATGALMLALGAPTLYRVLRDPQGPEATWFRNAVLADVGTDGDFDWPLAQMPPGFKQESADVPAVLRDWRDLPRGGDTIERAIALTRALTRTRRRGGAIRRRAVDTLAVIERTGGGYCADYSRVFNALAYAAGVPVRQWGFSFGGFGGRGHTFNEVWDEGGKRWVMIDAFNAFFPRDRETGEPLSALAFRERLREAPDRIVWQRIVDGRFGFRGDREALEFFRAGAEEWYLLFGNNVLAYDGHPLVRFAARFGRLPEQVAGLLTGRMPRMKVVLTLENRNALERLVTIKRRLLAGVAVETGLALALVWQFLRVSWR